MVRNTEIEDRVNHHLSPLMGTCYLENIEGQEYEILTVDETVAIDLLLLALWDATTIFLDTETTSLSPSRQCRLLQLSFNHADHHPDTPIIYITKPHQRILDALLTNTEQLIVGANIPFDIITLIEAYKQYDELKYSEPKTGFLNAEGRRTYQKFLDRTYDITTASQVLMGTPFPSKLESIAYGLGVEDAYKYMELVRTEKRKLGLNDKTWWFGVPLDNEIYTKYAGWDVCLVRHIYDKLKEYELNKMKESQKHLIDLENRTRLKYALTRYEGVSVDWKRAADIRQGLHQKFVSEMGELEESHGITKIKSNQQCYDALLAQGIEITAKAPKGGPSIRTSVLEDKQMHYRELEDISKEGITKSIAEDASSKIAFIDKILNTRSYQKDLSMIDNWIKNSEDPWELKKSRLYPDLVSIGTATMRSICREPNIQQINKYAGASFLRNAIIPHRYANETYSIFACDYKGQELRALANLTGDSKLADRLASGFDMHGDIGRQVFGPDCTKGQRNKAKAAIFAMLFGASVGKMAVTAGCSKSQAVSIRKAWHDTYSKAMLSANSWQYRYVDDKGNLHTPWGWVTNVGKDNYGRIARYRTTNYMVQGYAAFITKTGVDQLDKITIIDNYETDIPLWRWMIMTIHDEVVANAPARYAEDVMRQMVGAMEVSAKYVNFEVEGNLHGEYWKAEL